ncbi:MAG: hypothetical protein CMH52_04210 [Myxococcales bacterium]|nr:hypothetical protein [Myxococcales bacterium]
MHNALTLDSDPSALAADAVFKHRLGIIPKSELQQMREAYAQLGSVGILDAHHFKKADIKSLNGDVKCVLGDLFVDLEGSE